MKEILEKLVDNISYPIWIKNLELEIILANKEYAKVHNRKKEEMIGLKNSDLYNANLANKFDNYCFEIIKCGVSKIEEGYYSNEYKQCYIVPIKNDDNEVIAIAGIINAVTNYDKIKAKEYEINVERNLIRNIIDILPGIIFYKDTNSKYVYANKNCEEFYAKQGIENIIGKTDIDLNPDKKLGEKFIQDDKYIIENNAPIYNEVKISNGDGTYSHREVVKMPLLDDYNNIVGIVGRSLDITERKIYEEKLKYLSYTDILTGVNNRTCFSERVRELSMEKYMPLGVIMGDSNGLKLVNDTFGHKQGDRLLIEVANILKDVCKGKGEVFRIGGDEFILLIPNATAKYCEQLILEVLNKCKENKNEIFNVSISLGSAIKKYDYEDIDKVIKEAEDKLYRQKLLKGKSVKASILSSLRIGLGVRSVETEEHAERVEVNAVKLGEELGLEMAQIDDIRIVAALHDIGKIGISEHILLKPEKLTKEEYEIMKTHSEKGYRIVMASSELKEIAESVLYHHERYDGMGYPRGLKGQDIPLLARIISVCDSYDVMISDRVYKKAMSKEEALEELKRCSGTQFDPKVVEAFIKIIS